MQLPGRRFVVGEEIYSDWFPRGGDNMILRVQKIDVSGTITVNVGVYTKNSEIPGDGNPAEVAGNAFGVSVTQAQTLESGVLISGTTTTDTDPQGIQELVRFVVTCTGTAGDWMVARIFPPVFYDAAKPA